MDEGNNILRACQARIFRDIWRVTDPDIALKMLLTMEKNVDAESAADTPELSKATELLRQSPDPLKKLEGFAGLSLLLSKLGRKRGERA